MEDLSIYKKKHKIKQHNSFSLVSERARVKKIRRGSQSSSNYSKDFSGEQNSKIADFMVNDVVENTARFNIKYSTPTPKNLNSNHEVKGNYHPKQSSKTINNDISSVIENKQKIKKRTSKLFKKIDGSKILLLRADMILHKKISGKHSFLGKEASTYQYQIDDILDDFTKNELNSWSIPNQITKNRHEIVNGRTEPSINYGSMSNPIEYNESNSLKKLQYSQPRVKRSRIYNNSTGKKRYNNIRIATEENKTLQNSTSRLSLTKNNNTATLNESYKKEEDISKKNELDYGNERNNSMVLSSEKMKLPPMKILNRPKIIITKINQSKIIIKEIFPNINPSTYMIDSRSHVNNNSINDEIQTPKIKNFYEKNPLRIKNERESNGKRTPNSEKLNAIDLKSKEEQLFQKNFDKAQRRFKLIEVEKESRKRFDDLMVSIMT